MIKESQSQSTIEYFFEDSEDDINGFLSNQETIKAAKSLLVDALKGDSLGYEVVITTNVDNDTYQIVTRKKSRWSS